MAEFVKCPTCGWLHFKISRAEALAHVQEVNETLEHADSSGKATLEAYLHCFRCGADSASFVLAQASNAPIGATIQAVVVEC